MSNIETMKDQSGQNMINSDVKLFTKFQNWETSFLGNGNLTSFHNLRQDTRGQGNARQ